MTRPRLALLVLLAAILGLVFFFPAATGLLTDWWWFQEVGYQVVFTRELVTKVLLFLGVGTFTGLLVFLNLRVAQRGVVPNPLIIPMGQPGQRLDVTATIRRLSLPASLGLAVLAGLGATPAWDLVLSVIHRTSFGTTDPVFARDVGFYVFLLPAISAGVATLSSLVVLLLLMLVPVYFIRGDIIIRPKQLHVERSAGLHLAVVFATLMLLTALRLWFVAVPNLLFSNTGPLVGASYTDMNALLPALKTTTILAVVAGLVVLVGGFRGQLVRYTAWSIGVYIVVAILGRGVSPQVIQEFVVAPTELTRETPYLRYHIDATRKAWGLDNVEVRDLVSEASLTLADVRANGPTIENVRLWDRDPLLQTFGQLQEIRTYYDFVNVDDDRYWIDGKYRQVLLSPRELNSASLPTRTFINEHLTFTHGMGLTLTPVNEVTVEGLPVLFIQDLPPTSSVSLKVTRPQIYYGERTGDYVFVGTAQREFDHPSGEENVYAAYEGTGGVRVGSLLRRIIFATRFASSKILFSGDITGDSQVLYYRDIQGRAAKAFPFLRFDRDPYLVIADDGTLKWILDAYTVTNRYPYAQRLNDGTTYMRNSAKIVIDAYDGAFSAYISDADDPLIQTWSKIFPGIFVPMDDMPADLRAHIRYPDDLYRVQTSLYTTYHMDSPVDFYQREDQWQIPAVEAADGSVPFMRHIIMRLPEEAEAEFIYMVPFTPRGKDNLAAWMVARNDGDNYGKLRVYQLSRQSLVFGPTQIENRINQDTEISRQVSLWDQRGSQVIWGDLLVIPIESSLLYVRPLYLQAAGGRIPELKQVVVAYQNRVVMRETLDGALFQLFGGDGSGPITPTDVAATADSPAATASTSGAVDSGIASLITEARRLYEAALQAQRDGDWARYGEEIKQLGVILDRIAAGGQN